ncbi:MAG: efflux RND transporter periplasmic adaptor subunit [Gemmatimonadetes bacterium]|nr:efflux RND transporter periplasmic adaptor subunit [Gemmatimonadota bacterium]
MSTPSSSSSTRSFLVLAAAFLSVVAAVAWRLHVTTRPDEEEEQVLGAPEDEAPPPEVASAELFSADNPTPVKGVEVVRDTLWIQVGAAGRIRALRRQALEARVPGELLSLAVREGELVRRGQTLAVIDSTETLLELATARVQLLVAEAEYDRLIESGDENDSPSVKESRANAAVVMSGLERERANLARVELKLARSVVTAPFAGKIADIRVAVGERIDPGAELLTVLDISSVEVEVEVPEGELNKLEAGRRARVNLAAYSGDTLEARVSRVNPVIDSRERTGRAVLSLANPDLRLFPGMHARVLLDVEALPDRLVVPRSAVLQRSETLDRHVVFIYLPEGDFGFSDWRYVNLGRESITHVELVREGPENGIVDPGEIVLVDGHHYLSHQTKVRLVDDVAAAGGRPTR